MIPHTILDIISNTSSNYTDVKTHSVFHLRRPKKFVFETNITTSENVLITSASGGSNYFQGFRMTINALSPEFKAIRHNIVGSLGTVHSDVPFSSIDPAYDPNDPTTHERWHKLTPDYWVKPSRTLAELGTSLSQDVDTLIREYNSKMIKYQQYAQLSNVHRYFVFIVGVNHVISNFDLTPDLVDELCMRCRLGIAIETDLIGKRGRNDFLSDEQSWKEDHVQNTIEGIGRSDLEDVDFNHDLVEFSLTPLTIEESREVGSTILREYLATEDAYLTGPEAVNKYMLRFNSSNTHKPSYEKRVCNFPFICASRISDYTDNRLIPPKREEMEFLPLKLRSVWQQCFDGDHHVPLEEEEELKQLESEQYATGEPQKHKTRRHHSFKPDLTDEEELELAICGLAAKQFSWPRGLKEFLDSESHKGFHPSADTEDIESFVSSEVLTRKYPDKKRDQILPSLLEMSKLKIQEKNQFINSTDIFKNYIYESELVCFADLISNIVQELMLGSKRISERKEFTYKYLQYYKVGLVIKNTGTHIFCSIMYQKTSTSGKVRCYNIDTGRLGPQVYDIGDYYVSDWISFDANHLEHYMKCGPMMSSLFSHYLAMFKKDVSNMDDLKIFAHSKHVQFWEVLKMSLLVFLNNKLDVEELITAQRYFIMNILDEVAPDPYRFVKRLPEVLRSRLCSLLTTRCIDMMHYYHDNKVKKTKMGDQLNGRKAVYTNLATILCCDKVSIEQSIELFYVGYLVSKNRSSGAYSSFKICKKLFSEEFKYLKNRQEGKRVIERNLQTGSDHQADRITFKFYVISFEKMMTKVVGPNHKDITSRDIINRMSRTTFLELATLKASARPWHEDYHLEDVEAEASTLLDGNKAFQKFKRKLYELDPSSFKSRPKALEAISALMDEYTSKTGKPAEHPIDLMPFCLEELESGQGFNTDLFSKDQHGGIREITVLEIKMRVLQFFVEILSRTVCKYFYSETLTSPENKEKSTPKHYSDFGLKYTDFLTLCTSGDKKTWCQGHHSVRFANMLTGILHKRFHNMIYRILRLWIDKRVKLPSDLIVNFLANEQTKSTDEVFVEMRKRFFSGEAPFIHPGSQTVVIRSGMFQGLLHYASSVQHTMCQEVTSQIQMDIWSSCVKKPLKISVEQGSDDYKVLMSIEFSEGQIKKELSFLYRLIRLRARLTHLTGITDSDKTAHCLLDVVEYNSEWTISKAIVRPTLKWVVASMEVSLVESFITRLRQFSNNLTQVLEGGATTLECSLIQLNQAWLHYKLLGLDQHYHYNEFSKLLLELPDPNVGYFPLEADITCGLLGFDYTLYKLAKMSKLGSLIAGLETISEKSVIEYVGKKSKVFNHEASSLILKFGNLRKWKAVVARSGLPSVDEVHDYFDAHPEVAFTGGSSWKEDRLTIALKLHSPGVKASLSGHQPLVRMMVASSYILNKPCFTIRSDWVQDTMKKDKWTLLQVIREKLRQFFVMKGEDDIEESLRSNFPKWAEYDNMIAFEKEMNETMFLEYSNYRKRGKVLIEVFPDPTTDDFPLISMCKRKWFNHKYAVKVGQALFEEMWENTKLKYKFLKDTIDETRVATDMNVIQLKYFLESTATKGRKVKLMDTSAKSQSVLSTISRIFWDSIKLRSSYHSTLSQEYLDIRSNIFAILNFPYREHYKQFLIKELLSNGQCFKDENNVSLPHSGKGLKLIRDIMTDSISKEMAIQDINIAKDGTIGWFSIRQKFDKLKRSRIGIGEWRGKIGKVSVIISLEDNVATLITVNTLVDSDQTSIGLSHLLKEIHVKVSEKPVPSFQKFYYKPRKGLIHSDNLVDHATTLILDSSSVIDRFDDAQNFNWTFEFNPFGIRVQQYDPTGSTVTLYTERFTSNDWNRDSEWKLEKNTPVHYWHDSRTFPISSWIETFESLNLLNTSSRTFVQHIRWLRRSKSIGIYDLVLFENLFAKQFMSATTSLENRLDSLNLESKTLYLDKTLTDFNPDNYEFLRELTGVDFSYEIGTIQLMGEVIPEDLDDLENDELAEDVNMMAAEEAMEALKAFGKDHNYSHEVMMELNIGMPKYNNFFGRLFNYIDDEYKNVDLNYLLYSDLQFENPFGLILSYLSGRDRRVENPMYDSWDVYDSASQLIPEDSEASSIYTIARQQNIVEELRNSLPGIKGVALELVQQLLRRELRTLKRLMLVKGDVEIEVDDLRDIKKELFSVGLLDHLANRESSELSRTLLDSEDKVFYIKIMSFLYNHISYLKENEGADDDDVRQWLVSVEELCVSRKYIEILCDAFKTDIMLRFKNKVIWKELWRENDDHEDGSVFDLETHSWSFYNFYSSSDLEMEEEDSESQKKSSKIRGLSPIGEEDEDEDKI